MLGVPVSTILRTARVVSETDDARRIRRRWRRPHSGTVPEDAAAGRVTVTTSQRRALLAAIAGILCELHPDRRILVGVDGVDGAGKTTFADDLATETCRRARKVIRASTDGFHRPAAQRYRLGRGSPEGFYRDSYDYDRLRSDLLDPCSPSGSGVYRGAVFDVEQDLPLLGMAELAEPRAVVIVDGLFLHRSELCGYWDFSIFLDVAFDISIPRGAARGLGYGSPDPSAPSNQRYVEGQRMYFRDAQPTRYASIVVDYNDLDRPAVVRDPACTR
jgi:uridine kinase